LYQLSQIAKIIDAKILQQANDGPVEHILLDSRKILFPSNSIFFALNSQQQNAHLFIAELYNKGVLNFVVDELFFSEDETNKYPLANFLQVSNVLQALQDLATHHRKNFNFPVIAITGSNGKTIVKEWLNQLLATKYNIVRSPKSYNSQIGVPLSVWQMNELNNLGIFEAGISQPGEMEKLEAIIQPTIGIFTNIGEAHSQGFISSVEKINEKIKLFKQAQTVIYCKDDIAIDEALLKLKATNNCTLLSWGKSSSAVLQISSIQFQAYNTIIKAVYQQSKISIAIPFTNIAAAENAISCWCVLLLLGISTADIDAFMLQLKPVEMRLELKSGINNTSIINDSYSLDLNALTIALDFLQQQQQHTKRTIILSDILQSNKTAEELYKEVAEILIQKNINRIIGIGTKIKLYQHFFKDIKEQLFFETTEDFIEQFQHLYFTNETILLKGARLFEFEKISKLLEKQSHQTVLEINLTAVKQNLKVYQNQLSPGVKIMAMVKAFSYGSGSFEMANLLQFNKVDYLAVAYADEGVALRKAGITLPIMVLNIDENTFEQLVQYQLQPEIFSFDIYHQFQNYLVQNGINHFPIHLKLDTGMHRLGFEENDIDDLCNLLNQTNTFKIQTVFSHFVASDNAAHNLFTNLQAEKFINACTKLQKVLHYNFAKHIANTAAIHHYKNMQLDMVRLGIGLYGIDSETKIQQQLKNVSTLKTTIAQIKNVKAGETVGYDRKGICNQDTIVATVRIGYADGYHRIFSNGIGKMWLHNTLVPVIGNVCMDMTMLNITGVDAKVGDEVIVFGTPLPVTQLASWSNTIPYEILTNVSQRVKRIYYEE
jgi:Alr-MurF fusion protein